MGPESLGRPELLSRRGLDGRQSLCVATFARAWTWACPLSEGALRDVCQAEARAWKGSRPYGARSTILVFPARSRSRPSMVSMARGERVDALGVVAPIA